MQNEVICSNALTEGCHITHQPVVKLVTCVCMCNKGNIRVHSKKLGTGVQSLIWVSNVPILTQAENQNGETNVLDYEQCVCYT
jgi:hypothetical protein